MHRDDCDVLAILREGRKRARIRTDVCRTSETKRKRSILALAALGTFVISQSAMAQDVFPNRQIKLVVPFAAGGNTDVVARVTAAYMQKTLNVMGGMAWLNPFSSPPQTGAKWHPYPCRRGCAMPVPLPPRPHDRRSTTIATVVQHFL